MACITTPAEQRRIARAARKVGGYRELVRLGYQYDAMRRAGRHAGIRQINGVWCCVEVPPPPPPPPSALMRFWARVAALLRRRS